jgi:hypothetical protein
MKVTVGTKELKKGNWAGDTMPLGYRHRAYRLQERHRERTELEPCLKNLLEASKYTRHSARYEFWHKTGVWDAKCSKLTCHSVNVKGSGGWVAKRDMTLWGGNTELDDAGSLACPHFQCCSPLALT